MAALSITAVTPGFGAVVDDVKLRPDLDVDTVAAVRRALLDYKVIFLRDQSLDPSDLTALATLFGEPTPAHPVEPSVEGHPEVLSLDSDEGARADVWHSDLTFQERPPLGAMLHAEVVPEVGGDTIWVDMVAAYEALSATLRTFLEALTATHSPAKAGGYFAAREVGDGDKAATTALAAAQHPVVRVHPETGKRSLFVNPLFDLIQATATRPEAMMRWRWRTGDLAFWDNRCTMHYALRDFGTAPRRMIRVALQGDRPVGVAG
jgi:alpha-ketoglutarate-dependent taurine dioxygenase